MIPDAPLAEVSASLLPDVSGANIFLTLECNLDCPYCYVAKSPVVMEPAVVEATIDLIAAFARRRTGFFHTGFLGGEPFLRFPLLRYVVDELEARAGRSISFTVTTNGTVLTEAMVDWVRERGIRLVVSIDGDAMAMQQRAFRKGGHGSYDRVVAGVRRLQEADVPFLAQMTITQENADRLADNVAHVIGLGVRQIILGLASNDMWTPEQRAHLVRGYGRVFELYKEVFRSGVDVHLKFVHDEITGYLLRGLLVQDPFACGMLRKVVAVGVDGRVYPCQAMINFADRCVGDVTTGLDGARVLGADLPDTRRMPGCATCALRSFCRKCLAFNRASSADLMRNPSLACTAGRTTAVLAQDFVETMLAENNERFLAEFGPVLAMAPASAETGRSRPADAAELLELLVTDGPLPDESRLPLWLPGAFGAPALPDGPLGVWRGPASAGLHAGEGRGAVAVEFGAYRDFAEEPRHDRGGMGDATSADVAQR